jgi:hypothetical protein
LLFLFSLGDCSSNWLSKTKDATRRCASWTRPHTSMAGRSAGAGAFAGVSMKGISLVTVCLHGRGRELLANARSSLSRTRRSSWYVWFSALADNGASVWVLTIPDYALLARYAHSWEPAIPYEYECVPKRGDQAFSQLEYGMCAGCWMRCVRLSVYLHFELMGFCRPCTISRERCRQTRQSRRSSDP